MSNVAFSRGKAILVGTADWSNAMQTFKVLLASDEYFPKSTHKHVSEVKGELSTGGYKRQELTGRSIELDGDKAQCLADSVIFNGLKTSAKYKWVVVLRQNLSDSDSDLICALDMGRISLRNISEHTVNWGGKSGRGPVFSLT
jgi:hypothetical protein